MKRKIWIVTELFYPEETAVAFIFTRIANYLSKSYHVCVICGPEFYDINKKKFIDEVPLTEDVEIFRTKSLNLDKNSLIQRTIKMIVLSFRMGLLMCNKISKGEMVILSTNPALLLLFVRYIRHYKKIHLHILVHDVFPENAIPAKVFKNSNSILYRIIKFLFDKAYSGADHLIVIGKDMSEIISNKISHYKQYPKISIVPNWSNPERISLIKRYADTENKIILQYAGNIGRVQGLTDILDAFRLSNNRRLYLNLYGSGALFPYIKKYIQTYNLTNVCLSGAFSRNEENAILGNCDIGLVSLSSGMYGLGVPSKSYHLLSAGRPILYIGDPETEISNLVQVNNIGWSLDIRNKECMIDFFNNLDSINGETLKEMGKRARSLAENEYNEVTILELMQSKIESINNWDLN